MKRLKKNLFIIIFFYIFSLFIFYLPTYNNSDVKNPQLNLLERLNLNNSETEPFNSSELSNITLSVKLYELENVVEGNLTIDYYNNENKGFESLPFHLYPFGMLYDERPGKIDVLNVTTIGIPKIGLEYEVYQELHLMWVQKR